MSEPEGKALSPGAIELIAALEKEFQADPPPPMKEIVEGPPALYDERTDVMERFGDLRWTEVPLKELGFNADALHMMTDRGFAYYLPAFIRKCLVDYESADIIPMQVLWMLQAGNDDDRLLKLIGGMNRGQRTVIRGFIEFMQNMHPYHAEDAKLALETWHDL